MSVTRPTLKVASALVADAGAFAAGMFVIANPPPVSTVSASAATAAASASVFPLKVVLPPPLVLPALVSTLILRRSWPHYLAIRRLGRRLSRPAQAASRRSRTALVRSASGKGFWRIGRAVCLPWG